MFEILGLVLCVFHMWKTGSIYFSDVNVEHLQLLLFLFHSLPLMQKKALLLQLAQNIIRATDMDQKWVIYELWHEISINLTFDKCRLRRACAASF